MQLEGADEGGVERGRGEEGEDVFKEDAGLGEVGVLAEGGAELEGELGELFLG